MSIQIKHTLKPTAEFSICRQRIYSNLTGTARNHLLLLLITTTAVTGFSQRVDAAGDDYGPPNLLKTIKTPFGTQGAASADKNTDTSEMAPIALSETPKSHKSLSDRLVGASRLYLPEKMVLGNTEEFTIKGKPGSWVALAMADKNSGAKPLLGHNIRLGPDRKVVAIGQLPEGGVLILNIETPIQGDLVGSSLYFEAALWSKPDMSDVELAQTIRSQGTAKDDNGVLIAEVVEKKKGIKIEPQSSMPQTTRAGTDSGRP